MILQKKRCFITKYRDIVEWLYIPRFLDDVFTLKEVFL